MSNRAINRLALAAGLAALCALLWGCPKSNPATPDATPGFKPDASTATGLDASGGGGSDGSTAGLDASTPDSGPQPCSLDEDCGPTQRCGEAGACVDAATCYDIADCPPASDDDPVRGYCDNTLGIGCRCVKPGSGTADAGYVLGYCKRRLPPCAACTTDDQCGPDPIYFQNTFYDPGHCVEMDGQKVCLAYFTGKCTCGVSVTLGGVPDGGGAAPSYCVPQGSPPSCSTGNFLCCKSDGNCPPEHPLCDTATGRCQDICWYDFSKDETVGCRSDQVCNVDPAFLDPTSKNYGAGYCGQPCTADSDCTTPPHGRPDFVCVAEAKSAKRCRPPGCLDDLECINDVSDPTDPNFPYIGYCTRDTGECVCKDVACNCRTGQDPLTSADYSDCKSGYKCALPAPGQPGLCEQKNCIEMGGAQFFCGWTQFCCGEDRDGNANTPPDPCTDLTGNVIAQFGNCYDAPNPPWCAACDPTDYTSCSQAGYPAMTTDSNLCVAFGADAKGNDRGNSCLFACATIAECPAGFHCTDSGLEVDCSQDPTTCGNASNCKATGYKDQQGNPIMWCQCTTAGAQGGDCPSLDATDPKAPVSRCSDTGTPFLHCIWSHACLPNSYACKVP